MRSTGLLPAADEGSERRVHVLLCRDVCAGAWEDERNEADGECALPALGELAGGLRPFADFDDALKVLSPVEVAMLSALEIDVCLGGGLAKGHFKNLEGGVILDEDLAGGVGTPVHNSQVGEAGLARAKAALDVLLRERTHAGMMKFRTTLEVGRQGRGGNFVEGVDLAAYSDRSRTGQSLAWNEGEATAHLLPLASELRDDLSRGACGRTLRAGAAYRRADGVSVDVKWSDGVEELALPTLFPNGGGGYRGVVGSRE